MIRTVISLDNQEKKWLDKVAKANDVSMAEIIRLAIKEYKNKNAGLVASDIDALLEKTKGCWTKQDGLTYQRQLRDEWDDK